MWREWQDGGVLLSSPGGIITVELEAENEAMFGGEVEVDESYFGGVRKGKRDRGSAGKTPVFGLLKRGGKVYTAMIPNIRTATLMPIMERMIIPDSIVYTDSLAGYDAPDVSAFHNVRINHSQKFVDGNNHINGIENFWSQAKRRMRRFNGLPKAQFGLYLKECERRFNNSGPLAQLSHIRLAQLSHIRQWVKRHLGSLPGSAPK